MKLLFDTNILISNSKNKDGGLVEFLAQPDNGFFTSVVSLAEFRAGFSPRDLALYEEFRKIFLPIELDAETAELAGESFYEFKAKGREISLRDHFIAATALVHGLTLVTFNKKDFPHKGLDLYPT